MMGGKVAHEFMLLSDIGEDSLVLCGSCDFRSNMEVAECIAAPVENASGPAELELVATPGTKTIAELCELLKVSPGQTCKAVLYRKNADDGLVAVFIRGDLEVNETKLRNYLKEEIHPDESGDNSGGEGVAYGYAGPVGFPQGAVLLYDRSLKGLKNLVTGANREGYHYRGFTPERDAPGAEYRDFAKAYDGACCPVCGKRDIRISRGIEVGNIFQLGTKYSAAMNMQYLDQNGSLSHPVMGCYGIGVGRLAASVCEARHDAYGPIWPMAIAPWQLHLCAIRADDPEVAAAANALYESLESAGVEVLFDDRVTSAGIMFSDADLLGIPLRVIISPKTLKRSAVECAARDKSFTEDVPLAQAPTRLKELIQNLISE
jgi:prolyl-tRNA synthetase